MSNELNRKALKSGIMYTIVNFFSKGVLYILTPFFTRLLTMNEIGSFSNVESWFQLFLIVFSLQLPSTIQLAKFDYENDVDNYSGTILFFSSIVSIIIIGCFAIFNSFFIDFFSMKKYEIVLISICCFFYTAFDIYIIKSRIYFAAKNVSFFIMISNILSAFISLLFTITFRNKLLGRLVGYYGTLILVGIILYFVIIIKTKHINIKYIKYALPLSIPIMFHSLAGQLLSVSDKIMITKICGESINALYSVGYKYASIASVLFISFNSAFCPWLFENINSDNYHSIKTYTLFYIFAYLLIVFIILLFAPEAILILGGNNYIDAVYVVPPIIVSFIFQFIYSLYVNIETYYKKQKYIAIGTTISCIVNIILNIIFIPKYGYIAATYTTLIGYILLFLIHFFIVFSMGKYDIYNTKFIISILLLSIISIPLFIMLYSNNIIRYIIIIVTLLLFVVYISSNRSKIKSIINIFIQ